MILVDSSLWIMKWPLLDEFVSRNEVATCAPIVQEVLQGTRDERVFAVTRRAMMDLRLLDDPVPREAYVEAASIYRIGRRQGLTIRSSVDCLIAAIAIRNGVELLHADRDFTSMALFTPLRQTRVIP